MRWFRVTLVLAIGFGTLPLLGWLRLTLNPQYFGSAWWLGLLPGIGGAGLFLLAWEITKSLKNQLLSMGIWIVLGYLAAIALFSATYLSFGRNDRYVTTVAAPNGHEYVFIRSDFKRPWLSIAKPILGDLLIKDEVTLRDAFPGSGENNGWDQIEISINERRKLMAILSGGIFVDVLIYDDDGNLRYDKNAELSGHRASEESHGLIKRYFENSPDNDRRSEDGFPPARE